MEISWKIIFIVLSMVQGSTSTGILQVTFLSYTNPSHERLDQQCCNSQTSSCRYHCSNQFEICVSDSSSPTSCEYAKVTTKQIDDDDISFGLNTKSNGLQNPLKMSFQKWRGAFSINIMVYNIKNGRNIVAQFTDTIVLTATSNGNRKSEEFTYTDGVGRGSRKTIQMKASVACDDGYLLPDCEKRECIPRDDSQGHYTCDLKGEKVCLEGWRNVTADCTRKNATLSSSSIVPVASTFLVLTSKITSRTSIRPSSITIAKSVSNTHYTDKLTNARVGNGVHVANITQSIVISNSNREQGSKSRNSKTTIIHPSFVAVKGKCFERRKLNVAHLSLGCLSIIIIVILVVALLYQDRRHRRHLQKYKMQLSTKAHEKGTNKPLELQPIGFYGDMEDKDLLTHS